MLEDLPNATEPAVAAAPTEQVHGIEDERLARHAGSQAPMTVKSRKSTRTAFSSLRVHRATDYILNDFRHERRGDRGGRTFALQSCPNFEF